MGAQIPELVRNPTVYYRLDPGEPGVANPASASSSVYTVTGQESRNRARLKAEALREGREVIYLATKYKVRKSGSFVTAVGGTTTIITKSKPEAQDQNPVTETGAPEQGSEDAVREGGQLRAEQQRLEREQQDLKRQVETASGPEAVREEQRLGEIERRLAVITDRLKELGFESGALDGGGGAAPTAGMAMAAGALNAALNAAGQLLDVMV